MYKFLLKVDWYACYYLRAIWNFLFLKKGAYKFGTRKQVDETMSSVFGKAILDDRLTILGWFIVSIIEFVDMLVWTIIHIFSKRRRNYQDHCIASIKTFEDKNLSNLRKSMSYYEMEANNKGMAIEIIKSDPPQGGGTAPE